MKKKILLTLGVVATLFLLAIVIVFVTVDADSFRGFIEDRAEAVLDREVELGELRLSFVPVFGIEVDDVSVGARPSEGEGDLASVRSMVVGARLLPLLGKRLEVTSLVLIEPSLSLARNAEGKWNFQLGDETGGGASGEGPVEQEEASAGLTIDSLRVVGGRFSLRDASRAEGGPLEVDVTDLDVVVSGLGSNSLHAAVGGGKLRVVDAGLADKPLELALDDADLSLSLDSGGRPGDLALEMTLGGDAAGTRVAARGPLGRADGDPTALHMEVEGLPLNALGPVLPAMVVENVGAGKGDLTLDLTGRLPDDYTASGNLSVTGVTTELTGDRAIDARLELDLAVTGGGDFLELRKCDIIMGANTVGFTGIIEAQPEGRRIDLTLKPTSVTPAGLSFLLVLGAADLGLSITGEAPVEIDGGVRGLVTDSHSPEVRGRMRFSGVTVDMAALSRPVTDLVAEVSLDGRTIHVTGLSARVGDNDLAGTIKLEAAGVPTVGFDLQAQHANLDELLALMAGDEEQETVESGPPSPDSFLVRGVAQGRLRVADGSWASLSFRELDARLRMADGVATLDPGSMELYDGGFSGRLVSDLKIAPPAFEFSGDVKEIDLEPFLADQLDGGDLLAGRLTGRVAGRGAGADPEAIIRSLQGEGTASISDGKVNKLDVLGSVGQVAGVLGQHTLANLATTMTTDATQFSQMVGTFSMDGGRFRFDELLLESAAFSLGGAGDVDLMSSVLNGDFQIRFSPEVSGWMRKESSRAAELFWDAGSGRVVVPLGLSGPFDSARASVDWTSAAEGLVRRTVEKELAGLLGGALGGSRTDSGDDPGDDSPEKPPGEPGGTTSGADRPAAPVEVRRAESPSGNIVIEVTKTNWGGSFLAQDFKIEGRLRGTGVDRLRMVVVDATGSEVEKKDITNFAQQPGSDDQIFKTRADGKRLVLAKFPLTVRLTAAGAEGESAEVILHVTR